jgi:hypothetical protein
MLSRATILLALVGPFLLPAPSRGQAGDPPPVGEGGEIRGRVFGLRRGEEVPLPNVMLDLTRGLRQRTLITDSLGRYSAPGLEPGTWRVRALHVGYEGIALEVLVPRGGTVALDMELTSKPIALPPVVVRGLPLAVARPGAPPTTREVGEVSLRALEGNTGMVEAGLAQVTRSLPGQSDEAEPTDVLLMRGSAADLKLVLLDGAPIYTPFHLGGLVESFDPGTLGGASLFLGGAPARFDGGLSYILDLRTRSPARDRFKGEIAADLLTSRFRLESPIPGGAVLLGSRMVHGFGTPALGRGDLPYGYKDLLVRGEWGQVERIGAFLTGFWNGEEVRLDVGDLAFADGARWGNLAVTGGVSGVLGEITGDLRAAVSRYDARLPVADSLPLFARSRSERIRITGDLSSPWGDGTLRVGASMDGLTSDYLARGLDSLGSVVHSGLGLKGTSGGIYAEGTQPLGPSLTFRGGLRFDHFSGDGGLRAAPRVALTWLLTDNAALTLAAGRYHQFSALSSPQVEETLTPAPGDSLAPAPSPQLTVGSANHLVVSLDQILAPGLRLGLEGYVKNFAGVTGVADQRLSASGVDLRVAREGDRTSGWLGYTLTWFWASDEGFLGGDSRFVGRHLLSAGLSTRLSERTGLRLRVGYGHGLPYTAIPMAKETGSDAFNDPGGIRSEEFNLNGDNVLNEAPGLAIGPDEGFLRVEAEFFGSWTTWLGGRKSELRPYIRVLNALNRRDALFYHFDPWRDDTPRPLAELPILPLVGLEWVF